MKQARHGPTKAEIILKKLGATKGASIQMLVEATGWPSVRFANDALSCPQLLAQGTLKSAMSKRPLVGRQRRFTPASSLRPIKW
jgi:hypothetical protein